jgi:hypothetical protein
MKKQFLTLIAFAAGASAAYAQCGSTTTRTWDGGGADNSFFTADNWSGNVVPDCNDNIAFGNSSGKDCEIPSSYTTTGNITVNADYTGRITVTGTGTTITANNLTVNGTYFTLFPETGRHTFSGNVTIGDNAMVSCASRNGMSVGGSLTLNAGGFISFRTLSDVSLSSLVLNAYGQFRSPEKGTVSISGNFSKAKVSTFDHRFSTWTVNGTASQSITGSNGGSGLNTSNGAVNFWNVNLNKTVRTGTTADNWSMSDGSDTIIVENRFTIVSGDLATGSTGGFMFHDTLEMLGQGRDGHDGKIYCGGNKTADLILNDSFSKRANGTPVVVLKESNSSVLNFWKGTASEVRMPAAIINAIRGTISFPDDVTVNIPNRAFTIGANATLNMPATATMKMDASDLSILGSVNANQATLEFIGNSNVETTFGGGARKAFYNVVVNTAASNARVGMGSNDTLEVLNDLTISIGMFATGTGQPNDDAVVYVNGDFNVDASASANTYAGGQIIVLGGSGNSQYRGDALLSSGRIIIDKANASDVVTAGGSGNTVFVGSQSSSNALVDVHNGVLSFVDKDAVLAGNTTAGSLIVDATGRIEAPATDTLDIRASWNFANRTSLDAKGGTIRLGGSANYTYTQNAQAVIFNNLLLNQGSSTKTWGSTDTIVVKGDLTMSSQTLIGANLVFYGDITVTGGAVTLTSAKAVGSNDQTITLNSGTVLQDEGLTLEKSAGKVFSATTNLRFNSLRLAGGILNTNGNVLRVDGSNTIYQGSSTSFIEGAVTIASTAAWSGNRYFIPVGRGSNYRPVQLHNLSTTNTFIVEYYNSDTVSDLGTAGSHGIDAFSTSDYWRIQRTAGTGATNVELSTLGKDVSWNDGDIRVARWNATSSIWENYGPSTGASGNMVLASTTDFASNMVRFFTIGADNVAPIAVRNEGISGNELDVVSNSQNGNSQAVAQAAISFNVFPNPVAETLNIALSGANKGTITLSDLSGKVLGVYSAETRSINMSSFAAGVYFATFSNGSERITQRVIRN